MYRVFINNTEIGNNVIDDITFTESIFSTTIDGTIRLSNPATLRDSLKYDRNQNIKILIDDVIDDKAYGFSFNINYQDTSFSDDFFRGNDVINFSSFYKPYLLGSSKKIYDDKIENIFDDLIRDSVFRIDNKISSIEKILHPCNNKSVEENIQYLLQFMGDVNGNGGALLYHDTITNKLVLTNIKSLLEQDKLGYPIIYPSQQEAYIGYANEVNMDYSFDQNTMLDNRIFNNVQHGFNYINGEQIKKDELITDIIKNVNNRTIPFDSRFIDFNTSDFNNYNKSEELINIYKSNLYWRNAIQTLRFNVVMPTGSMVRKVGGLQDLVLFDVDDDGNGVRVDNKYTSTCLITEITQIFKGDGFSQNLKLNSIGYEKTSPVSDYDNLLKL